MEKTTMIAEYLRAFFNELEKQTESKDSRISHAIAQAEGALCVLISAGDVRVKVCFDDFGLDPAKAASDAFAKFKLMTDQEIQRAIEEVR